MDVRYCYHLVGMDVTMTVPTLVVVVDHAGRWLLGARSIVGGRLMCGSAYSLSYHALNRSVLERTIADRV